MPAPAAPARNTSTVTERFKFARSVIAHFQQLKWIEKALAYCGATGISELAVLEIGSYDVNGSIRQFFTTPDYIGVDLKEGPGVDVVGEGQLVDLGSERFDLAISCEVFEHNPYWKETLHNMHRMMKPGGILLMTCASRGRREHGTTRTNPDHSPGTQSLRWDYYHNLTQKDFSALPLAELFEFHHFYYNKHSQDLYLIAKKPGKISRLSAVTWEPARFEETTRDAFQMDPKSAAKMTALRTTMRWITRAPFLGLSHLLPDALFQDLQVGWHDFRYAIKGCFKKTVS